MKLNKIRGLGISRRRFILFHGPDCDWITDGVHMWAVEDIRLTRESLTSLFWLSRKQADKCLLMEEYSKEPCYTYERKYDETQMEYMGDILSDGEEIAVFQTDMLRAVYIKKEALTACSVDLNDADEDASFGLRYDQDGEPMIAVYAGMFAVALLSPVRADVAELMRRDVAAMSSLPVMGFEGGDNDVNGINRAG